MPAPDDEQVCPLPVNLGFGEGLQQRAQKRRDTLARQLVCVHPLAEDASRREAPLDEAEELRREEIVDAGDPGVGGLRDDGVVALARIGEMDAPVLEVDDPPGVGLVLTVEIREEPSGSHDGRLDLDGLDLLHGMGQHGVGRDA